MCTLRGPVELAWKIPRYALQLLATIPLYVQNDMTYCKWTHEWTIQTRVMAFLTHSDFEGLSVAVDIQVQVFPGG